MAMAGGWRAAAPPPSRAKSAQKTEKPPCGGFLRIAGQGRQYRSQRWRALKRGLDLQITKTLPRRRTTLQSR
jgi:hypothetical protein